MREVETFASVLVDQAVASWLMPWPCPSEFGPNGRYRLEELVGAGRSSLVYRATDLHLSSEGFRAAVAVKISRRGENGTAEALTARRIVHPNVLRVLDRGMDSSGCNYVVTEFVQGGDLQQHPGPWEPRRAAEFIAKLARAVHASHSAGVVHCDLKPANILLTLEGDPKLADFDLSRSVVADSTASRGNVAFMSPEQFAGDPEGLTPLSDIYALGGLLFHLLTGRLPHGETPQQVAESHARGGPPPSTRSAADLDRICSRALSRSREGRHESAAALAGDLERWLAYEPLPWGRTSLRRRLRLWSRRHPYRVAGILIATVIICAAGWAGWGMIRNAQWEQQTRMAAQAESVRHTQEQVEDIQGRVKAHIGSIIRTLAGQRRGDLQDQMLPTLVWLQWIADVPVIGPDGKLAVASERASVLRGIVESATAAGRENDLDIRLARYCLAYFLVMDGQTQAAAELMPRVREDWAGRVRPQEPMMLSIEAMESCVKEELDRSRSAIERRANLAAIGGRLSEAGTAEPRAAAGIEGRESDRQPEQFALMFVLTNAVPPIPSGHPDEGRPSDSRPSQRREVALELLRF